jgi:hypothetical protein
MGYTGTSIPIPLGELGLQTDSPMTSLPPNALLKANNVSLYSGRIEKTRGTIKYNTVALPSPEIVAVNDYFPTTADQRLIAVTSDGKIWRDTGDGTFSSNTPIEDLATAVSTDTHIVSGGQEESGANKKLFILTGAAQIQVIDGDAAVTADISGPSADWASANFPTFGLIYQGRLFVMNSAADPHRIYGSSLADHEDFATGSPPTFSIFPGEGDGILCAAVYRGLMFIFKKPFGVYILDGRNPDPVNWTTQKYSDSFGVDSPHSVLQVLTDLIAANSFGSYTSLQASDQFGDFEAGDILANHLVEDYIRSIFNSDGIPFSQCVYYPEKKVAYFTGQASSTDTRNQMVVMDVARNQLRFTVDTKERPNCIALRKDSQNIQRPMYGDKEGFVWLMDKPTYNRDSQPYIGEFQTAYTDFSFASSELGGKNKLFDFLEMNYVATGNNPFYVDVYVDGSLRQTLVFQQNYGAVLDSFILDVDTLAGDPAGSSNRKRLLSCAGKRISFRVYNNSFNEAFKVERMIVSFRVSAEQITADQI